MTILARSATLADSGLVLEWRNHESSRKHSTNNRVIDKVEHEKWYQNRIKHLEEAHRALDKQIDSMEKTGIYDDLKIEELKKQRLRLKDDIVILKHKHEAVMQEAQAEQEARRNGLEL